MKKKIIIKIVLIILLVFILVIGFFLVREYVARNSDKDSMTTVENDIEILSKEYPTLMHIYGEELKFDDSISTNNISQITSDIFRRTDDYDYQLLIINDLSGKNVLSDDEWMIIKEVLMSNNDINFLYLGNKQFDKIIEVGIVEGDRTMFQDGDLSLGLFYEGETAISVYGTYTSTLGKSQKDVCEAIMREQAYSIKIGNE
ncbi:MAG: hypothetical protein IJD58_06010 [Lachnospiraceae bacterium]|nr:hypothetical protein [Lachnospiraceae bacterium]